QMEPDERSRAGLFLAFQYPAEIPGVSVSNFLRTAINARKQGDEEIPVDEFQELLREQMDLLDIDPSFAERSLNDGFSGGEKKRTEILQLAPSPPSLTVSRRCAAAISGSCSSPTTSASSTTSNRTGCTS
ncbi:MAG: hypothetical protein ABEK12_02810, partial [Candidatus Nanohaloarchaea archaeon]